MDSTNEQDRHNSLADNVNENENQITKGDQTCDEISHDIDYVLENIVGSGGWGQ